VRQLLFLSSVIFACVVPALAQESSDSEQLGYKGPVKSVRVQSANPRMNYEITFDREGRKVEELYYAQDGKPNMRRVYTYGAGGQTEERYGPDGKLQQRTVKKVEFDKARRTSRMTFTYELSGHSPYDSTIINKYDSQGRLVEGSSYDGAGKLQSRSTWKYGADGRLEEFVFYNDVGSVGRRTVWIPEGSRTFVYGDDGALVSTETQGRQVCEESDQYGNCKRGTTVLSINRAGKVEDVTSVVTRTFTYH
jgi:hypothetical protein